MKIRQLSKKKIKFYQKAIRKNSFIVDGADEKTRTSTPRGTRS
jgi:hypothetical protein